MSSKRSGRSRARPKSEAAAARRAAAHYRQYRQAAEAAAAALRTSSVEKLSPISDKFGKTRAEALGRSQLLALPKR
jgi:hypothetical protein